jgi:uncharacterized protein (DUF2235 family)
MTKLVGLKASISRKLSLSMSRLNSLACGMSVLYITMTPETDSCCRDTVCAVGLTGRTLPFTGSNTAIRYFRHAISLDEHRAKFKANYYHLSDDNKGTKLGELPRSNQRHPFYRKTHPHLFHNYQSTAQNKGDYDDGRWETNVLEVWFAGCHAGTSCLSNVDVNPDVIV